MDDNISWCSTGICFRAISFSSIYNDIVEKINTNIRLFADDTSLFTVIENQESIQLLNEDLIEIAQWSDDWLIILNHTKTNSMTFTRKKETNWDDAKFNNVVIKDNKTHTHIWELHFLLMQHGVIMYREFMRKQQPA